MHFATLCFAGTVSLLPLPANSNFSSRSLFIAFSSSICSRAFCRYSCSILTFSVLHLPQLQFPLSAAWAFTLPQL